MSRKRNQSTLGGARAWSWDLVGSATDSLFLLRGRSTAPGPGGTPETQAHSETALSSSERPLSELASGADSF